MSESERELDVPHRDSAIYLLRTAQQHHVQLSAMADQKANIVIGVSLVILTLSLGRIQNGEPSLPLLMLSLTAVVAGLFAVLAVVPRTSLGRGHEEYANPLFFGHFAQQSAEEFRQAIARTLASDQSVYYAMAMDFYMIGRVLYRKKYRYLGFSYRTFVAGLLLTFLALAWEVGGPLLPAAAATG